MSLIELAKYRKPKPQKARPPEPQYECLKCRTTAFNVRESGLLDCVNCGAIISNLLVIICGNDEC